MSVDVTNETQWVIDPKVFSDLGIWVLDQMRVSTQSDLTIMFVDPDPIAELHMRWMNLEGPTDVMSFPMDELRPGDGKTVMEGVLGDIVICPWVAAQQAAAAGHSTMQEMLLLTIHGILHLLGYDHVTPEQERQMFGLQRQLLLTFFALRHDANVQATLPAGKAKPVGIMISNSRIVSLATKLTPFARIGGDKSGSKGPGRRSKDSDLSDDEELEKIQLEQGKAAIDRLVESNDFDPEVSEMLRNVLTLSDTLTREIMVPRTDMICMERDSTLSSALKLFSRSGFSRVPVIGEDVDDLIGVAYLKDAVRATAFNPAAMERAVESIVRQPLLVPESKPVDDLFHEMQRSRQHVAVVVDEYGGIAGMVTIEDAIEQIVGELEDEHDRTQRTEPEKIGDNKWKMPARTPIADLEEIFEIDIDEDDVDTVYGLLTKILGRVPIVGASAVTRGLRLTAVDSAGRRKKVSTIVVEPAHVEGGEENNKTHEETDGEPVEGDDTASKE